MLDNDLQGIDNLSGADVFGDDGDKVGTVGQIYLDDETGRPAWVTVATGWFGTSESFVPLDRAERRDGGLYVPFSKDTIKGAPHVESDQHISKQEEQELYRYYSMDYVDRDDAAYANVAGDRDVNRGVDVDRDVNRGVDVDRDVDTTRRTTDGDDDMVLREEQLKVGTERVETGRVRLRKRVVSEERTVTVPVEREEYVVERVPLAEGEVAGGKLGEGEASVTLTEERPVVEKEVVGTERVSLGKQTVTEQQQVTETVGREEVDVETGQVRDQARYAEGDDRSLLDKAKDKLDRDNDGKVL